MMYAPRAARDAATVGGASRIEDITGYLARVGAVLGALPPEPIAAITEALVQAARDDRQVLIVGNGGSAATASHFACDLAKTAAVPGHQRLRALALTDNVPLMTALSNDQAYEDVFAEQVRTYARPHDLLIAISASGNSPNVLAAAQAARELGACVIGVTGFGGGSLRLLCDICLVVPSGEYGPVEDAHLVVVHAVTAAIRSALQATDPSSSPPFDPSLDAQAAMPPAILAEQAATFTPTRLERVPQASQTTTRVIALRPRTTEAVPVRTVFLDRDGVINRNRAGYVMSWDDFEFLPGSLRALARLHAAGYRLFVVTNQACVGKGLVSSAVIEEIHQRMGEAIQRAGGHVEAVLYCPHHPDDRCECRKPKAGLLLRARDEYGVDLSHATLIGDSAGDMRAAAAAGVPSVLVLSGLGWRTALGAASRVSPSAALALNLDHASRLLRAAPLLRQAQQLALRSVVHGALAISRTRSSGQPPPPRGDRRLDARAATNSSGVSTWLGGLDA